VDHLSSPLDARGLSQKKKKTSAPNKNLHVTASDANILLSLFRALQGQGGLSFEEK
jgi:hypothetical protein